VAFLASCRVARVDASETARYELGSDCCVSEVVDDLKVLVEAVNAALADSAPKASHDGHPFSGS